MYINTKTLFIESKFVIPKVQPFPLALKQIIRKKKKNCTNWYHLNEKCQNRLYTDTEEEKLAAKDITCLFF